MQAASKYYHIAGQLGSQPGVKLLEMSAAAFQQELESRAACRGGASPQ